MRSIVFGISIILLSFALAQSSQVQVTFISDPSGAEVSLNAPGQPVVILGVTPLTAALPPNAVHWLQVAADEPYEAYDLYKPFFGNITTPAEDGTISIWLDRTSASEQSAQRAVHEALNRPAAPVARPAEIRSCCKYCSKGKPCGNSCISRSYTCRQPVGCAC